MQLRAKSDADIHRDGCYCGASMSKVSQLLKVTESMPIADLIPYSVGLNGIVVPDNACPTTMGVGKSSTM